MQPEMVSPSAELAGKTVFVTGGLGFLGSVVVEQLLRLTEVKKVYLLARGKKQLSAAQRVDKLLCSALFNMLHEEAAAGGRNVFSKVAAVEGDMNAPGLGLSEQDAAALAGEVQVVIHCAASLELDAPIQKTLRSNYLGTQRLLRLAATWPRLAVLLFTSTYFVNNFKPRNSLVREELHNVPLSLPLSAPDEVLTHSQLVEALLAMEPESAEAEAAALMRGLNFTSTYAFGKLLTEHLVGEAQLQGVPKVIVRPSLISSLAGDPYPGYINNFAGSPGFMMAYGAGFFHSISSMAYASDYLLDLIPCDTVAALINAAAAAGAADAGPAAAPGVTIYHAASAAVYPLHMAKAIGAMAQFWTANPPPLRLPFSTYFTYQGKHEPSPWGLAIGRWLTEAKLWPICKVLEWSGRGRKAVLLRNAFKALCVQNSFNYNRSIVSCVDNCQTLRKRIEPKEQPAWQIIYDGAAVNWDDYGLTFLSGVRRLLFRCPCESTGRFTNLFTHKPDAPAAIRELILQASAPPPSSTSLLRSADSYIGAAAAPLSSRSSSNSSMACSESSSVEAAEIEAAVSPAAEAQVVVTAAVDGAGKGLAAAALKVQLSVDAGRVVVAAC